MQAVGEASDGTRRLTEAREALVAAGIRSTRPREVILAAFMASDRPLTIEEVQQAAVAHGRVPWATVDKTIRSLASAGAVRETPSPDGRRFAYVPRGAPAGPRAQVLCPVCGRSERVSSIYVGRLLHDLQRRQARRAQGARVEIVAECVGCEPGPCGSALPGGAGARAGSRST